MENIGASIKGIYRDILTDGKGRIIHDSGWSRNTIVIGCRILLAGLMINRQIAKVEAPGDDPQSSAGILHLEVGQGLEEWDEEGPPPVDEDTDHLETPAVDDPITLSQDDFVFLTKDGKPSTQPTSRLQVTVILEPRYPAPLAAGNKIETKDQGYYPLREFGLFGRFDNEVYMVNCVRHPVIEKSIDTTLTRCICLYF